MPSFSYPGIYIQELPGQPGPIVGASPSTMAAIGWTLEGPANEPVLVTSFPEFTEKFGGFTEESNLPTSVFAFFQNGGSMARIVRVAPTDAVDASCFTDDSEEGEALTANSGAIAAGQTSASFTAANALSKLPLTAGSLSITISTGEVWSDDGAGGLTGNGGGTGTVDYQTGELTMTFGAAAGGETFEADYSFHTYDFTMKWPGEVGNQFRVLISGDPNFEDMASAKFTRFAVEVQRQNDGGLWDTVESFSGVDLEDPSSSDYIVTVLSDDAKGSKYLSIRGWGNDQAPAELAGEDHASEAGTLDPSPDGAEKQFSVALASGGIVPATSGAVTGTAGAPWALTPGDSLTVAVDGGGAAPCTFDAATASVVSVGGSMAAGVPGDTFDYEINSDGITRSIDLNGQGGSVGDFAIFLNASMSSLFIVDDGGQLRFTTDQKGSGAKIEFSNLQGDTAAKLGISAGATSGTGDVANIEAVSLAEFKTVVEADAPGCTVTGGTFPTITSNIAGAASSIQVASAIAIVFPAGLGSGVDATSTPVAASSCNPFTYTAEITVSEQGIQVGLGNAGAAPPAALPSWCGVSPSGDDLITSSNLIFNWTSGAPKQAWVNSAGNIFDGANTHGAVDLATGAITLSFNAGDEADAGTPITCDVEWGEPISLEDDGLGNVQISASSAGPSHITLNTSGANSIDYGDETASEGAVVEFMLKASDDPNRGPSASVGGTGVDGTSIESTYLSQPAADDSSASMSGGDNGSALSRSSVSAPALAADDKGLYALNKTDDLLNVIIPDFETDPTVSGDLIDYCENRMDRFAVISVPEGLEYADAANYKKVTLNKNSSYAALYYPHIQIIDPVTEKARLFPSGGHICGVYARTDSAKNVSKAPAGTDDGVLRFSTGLEYSLTPAQVGVVNLAHVNAMVQWTYTGRAVWGARTLEAAGEFPYIQMRRLFMYLEKSVFNNTWGFVFENNGPGLQASVKFKIEAFLLGLFTQGYFSGSSPAEAFFVVCDASNNTAENIAKGILTCDIGVAPTRPAEFVLFRFQQKALEG